MRKCIVRIAVVFAMAWACQGQGIITTVAGSGNCCNSADGGQAIATYLPSAGGITRDSQGNLYIFDVQSSKVRKVSASGVISTVAGNGTPGYSGDGGLAINASMQATGSISGLAVDSKGNLFISDGYNNVIRKVDPAGIITTYAGNGQGSFAGDGGQATKAQLWFPAGIALDNQGNLYIADASNNRVRKVNAAGIITTVAGNGNVVYSGDGVQATATAVRPEGVTVDSQGNLYIAETSESRIRKVDPSGIISTIAGQTKKTNGFSGDGGLAINATLAGPIGLVVDGSGNLYFADNSNSRIRKVDAAGIITTYAGITGTASTPIGDNGPATSAFLGNTKDVVLDPSGNLYLTGTASGTRIRKVAPSAGFSANPTSLSFSYATGGTAPPSQTVSLTSSTGSAGFTAAASGAAWLSVNPTSGTAPATLTVSINPAGIAAGTYTGAITVTPTGTGLSSFSFNVILTVTGANAPTITAGAVYNALSYQTTLAPGVVFVIFGSGMGPSNLVAGSSPNYQDTLGGTSITFTPSAGGAAVNAKMVYTLASQAAAFLPSSVAPGTYSVRVSYNGLTSAPQTVTVAARNIGIATANSSGAGTVQATIGNVNGGLSLTRFTTGSVAFGGYTWTLTPAHPGDTLVLWGTGGGADLANDSGSSSGDQTAAGNFSVIVAGRQITPLYAGASSGYPGLWQINFTLPSDITPDCFATAQVSGGGALSNSFTIPIAAGGQSVCTDSQLSSDALKALDAGGSIVGGGLAVAKVTSTSGGASATQETFSAEFASYTAAEYAAIFDGIKIGACVIHDRTAAATAKDPATPDAFLNAGSTIPVKGPGLPASAAMGIISTTTGPVYDYLAANGTFQGGTYTATGTGGTAIGAFTASVTFPTSFTVTNFDSMTTIDRSKPLTLNWSGSGIDNVFIIGSTYSVVGKDASNTNIIHNVSFSCQVPGSSGSYTVPTSVLGYLLPVSVSATNSASLTVEGGSYTNFKPPILNGNTFGFMGITSTLGFGHSVTVQ